MERVRDAPGRSCSERVVAVRLSISYRMHFRYSEPVTESQNEVRVRPRSDDRQQVLSYRLASLPELPVLSVIDYWGTWVEHLGIRAPHTELELLAEAAVETDPNPAMEVAPAPQTLADEDFRSEHYEYLAPSEHVCWEPGDAVAELAASAVAGAASVPEMVSAVVAEVRSALRYQQGSTDIGVTLPELLAGGEGVCQDFAHLAAGMLRSTGVPTRYVSGYLFALDETAPDASYSDASDGDGSDGDDRAVSVQTHAWIEAAVPGWGWWALDPTNGGEVGERHVVIGCGRDYGDVPPVRGVFAGSGTPEVDSEVVIGRHVGGRSDGISGDPDGTSTRPRPVLVVPQSPNRRDQRTAQEQSQQQ